MDVHQVIKRPLHTEKSVDDIRQNDTYHFEIAPEATKTDVKRAVEELFDDVKVLDVRTCRVRGKQRRLGFQKGRTPDKKKAMVRIRPGDVIDLGY